MYREAGSCSLGAAGACQKYQALVGNEFCQAVEKYTDMGKSILEADFILKQSGVDKLVGLKVPAHICQLLENHVGESFPVEDPAALLADLDESTGQKYRKLIFSACKISDEYSMMACDDAWSEFDRIRKELIRKLPELAALG